jgi:hypothetical protein
MGATDSWSKFVAVSRSYSKLDDRFGQRVANQRTEDRGQKTEQKDFFHVRIALDCFGLAWFVALSTFI